MPITADSEGRVKRGAKHAANAVVEPVLGRLLDFFGLRARGPFFEDQTRVNAATTGEGALTLLHSRAEVVAEHLPDDQVFNNYRAGCIHDIKGLADAANVGLVESSALEKVKTKIAAALTSIPATETMSAEISDKLKIIKDRIKENPVSPNTVAQALLSRIQAPMAKAMAEQHKAETKELTAVFDAKTDTELQELKDAFGVDTQGLQKVKQDMLAALKKDQEDKLKALNDSLTEKANALFKLEERDHLNRSIIAEWLRNERNGAIIQEGLEGQSELSDGTSSELTAHDGKTFKDGVFKGIDIGKFPPELQARLKTTSGISLTSSDDGNSFEMRLPNRFFSPFFYSGKNMKANIEGDLTLMAMEVKKNYNQIFTEFEDTLTEKESEKLVMAAYTAAIKVGFEPDKIKISVRGTLDQKFFLKKDEKDTDKRPFVDVKAIFAKHGVPVPTEAGIKKVIEKRKEAETSPTAVDEFFKTEQQRTADRLRLKDASAALRGGAAAAAADPSTPLVKPISPADPNDATASRPRAPSS